ncbi:MAG: SDR family oxidoreductase [Acidimicrobiales bacterium]|nr:SDR family oxidoreductase [Hyphomonadaceae bacterium]RZV43861.1 MAG: SDR family oxidoreductase [Acidimicrobiales bacterium]
MPKPTDFNRRQLMIGTAIAGAALPIAACAASESESKPDLSGKSVLITGCSSGFGRLGAIYYASLGAKVFASMRNLPREEAKSLQAIADKDKLELEIIEIDVLSDQQVERGVTKVLEATDNKLDVLINNAGIGITGPVELQDMQATKLAFDTNVFGVQRMLRACLPAMRAAGEGQIFNISSQIGRLVVPGAGHYCATKFALESLSEQLAYEMVPRGIDVTIIEPGGYPTKIWVNRNVYTGDLKKRSDPARVAGYPMLAKGMGVEDGSSRSTDPMDVPREIARLMALPKGTRPLRKEIHPTWRPQEKLNKAAAEAQLTFLGKSPLAPWIKAVHGRD